MIEDQFLMSLALITYKKSGIETILLISAWHCILAVLFVQNM